MLEKASGSLRFELTDGKAVERWRVDVRKGDVAVSHKAGAADCVLRAPKPLFDKLASGRENAMAAVLRGALIVEGDIDLLLAFQRIFPSPPAPAEPQHDRLGTLDRKGRVAMADDLVKILDGNTFVVSDTRGDIEASLTDPTGLFSFDTRFLSKWVLTINGDRLNPLSVDDLQYFESRFFLVPGTGTVYVDAKLSVIRRRSVGAGFQRGAHGPQSRQPAGQARRPDRRGLRLRRSVRGQGRVEEEGQVLDACRTVTARARVRPGHLPA